MFAKRLLIAIAVASFTLCGAAQADPATPKASHDANLNYDFALSGVRIFHDIAQSSVNGHGNPGDGAILNGDARGDIYHCENGMSNSGVWWDITNQRTGVRGWVPYCNIVSH